MSPVIVSLQTGNYLVSLSQQLGYHNNLSQKSHALSYYLFFNKQELQTKMPSSTI